jgi:hypothetical protein
LKFLIGENKSIGGVMVTHSGIENIAKNITRKYGFNECLPCANELRRVLIKAGISGKFLHLTTKGGRGFIVMKAPNFVLPFNAPSNSAISDNGQHFGVKVENYIFDNIHRSGILHSLWIESFDCDVHQFDIRETDF